MPEKIPAVQFFGALAPGFAPRAAGDRHRGPAWGSCRRQVSGKALLRGRFPKNSFFAQGYGAPTVTLYLAPARADINGLRFDRSSGLAQANFHHAMVAGKKKTRG
jgi:hypothetical protein